MNSIHKCPKMGSNILAMSRRSEDLTVPSPAALPATTPVLPRRSASSRSSSWAGLFFLVGTCGPLLAANPPLLSSPAAAPSTFIYTGGTATLSVAIQDTNLGGVQSASATVQFPDGSTTPISLSLATGIASNGIWQGQYAPPINFGPGANIYNVSFSATDGGGNKGETPPVQITVAPPTPSDPAIQLTSIPAFGSFSALSGSVKNVSPQNYSIAILIFLEGLGWYSKPFCSPLLTTINQDGSWSASITTGNVDNTATQIAVYLVPSTISSYSCLTSGAGLPASLESAAVAKVLTTRTDPNQSMIQFAGMNWWVKSNTVPLGPGPTNFSSAVNKPFVDPSGNLHLKLIQSSGAWYGSEIVSSSVLGNGTFSFTLGSDEANLDPNVVVGLYTWSNDPAFSHREIDVELSRFGNASDPANAQFVVQPSGTSGNRQRFTVPSGVVPSSYSFQLNPAAVDFYAAQGTNAQPAMSQSVIRQWSDTTTVPQPGNQNVRLNVWLFNSAPPLNGQPVDVVVNNFQFTPLTVTAGPLAPTTGTGATQIFVAQYSDPAGISDLNGAELWFNPSTSFAQTASSCLVFYSPAGNQLYLQNDAGVGWIGPSAVGVSGTLSNSQCSLDPLFATVATTSNQLTLSLPMTYATAFGGVKNVYGNASGSTLASGWQTLGTWTVPSPQAPQTITFGSLNNVTYGTNPFAISATATSGLTIVFASNFPSVCSVSGSTVTLLNTGTCSITASQPGNSAFLPAPTVTQPFLVLPEPQAIIFGALSNQTFGSAPAPLTASATSGLPVTFTSNTSTVCTVSSINVTLVAGGLCSITASQAGNTIWAAATSVIQTFTIGYPCASIDFCAFQVVNQRATANQSAFYVYLDADSAFNHGFASGLFFSNDINPSSVVIDPACLDSTTSATGCATDPTLIDRNRGHVFRISFPALGPSDYVGLNFQDPQNYIAGDGSSGYNLAPADAIQFEVRSPGSAVVQFGVGGCVSNFYEVGQTWQTLTIPLNTLDPPAGGSTNPCPPDILATHILFTVTTNGARQQAATTVLLDNVQFTPVPARQMPGRQTLSLPISTQTFAVIPQTANPIPPDQANRNVAAIYESALVILTLLRRGQPSDIANALEIADTMDYALHHDNVGDPVPPGTDGSTGLHNAYMAGDIGLQNAQSTLGTHAGDARLAGFSGGTNLCGSTGFCLVLDGATGGNNAWAIFSLVAAYLQSGRSYYLTDAETIGSWIINRLQDQAPVGLHGYFVGFNDAGPNGLQQPNFGKSTENNADIFGAFSLISRIETARGNSAAGQKWLAAATVAGNFVASMQIPGGGFYVGTVTTQDAKTPAAGHNCPQIVPPVGNDVVNTCEFIDSDTFTILPMAAAGFNSIDWAATLQHVLSLSGSAGAYSQTVTSAGQTYSGFDLVPAPASTGVAFEFTGQVAESCLYLDALLSTTQFQTCGNTYASQIANAQASAPFGDGIGLVASIVNNGGGLPPLIQCLSTPYQCIPERVGLAATTWAIATSLKFNPMALSGVLFNAASVSFTSQTVGTSSQPAVVTATNSGTATLTISQISISGANSTEFTAAGTCTPPLSLAPGMSCSILLTFSPSAPGARAALLSLVANGYSEPLPLSGQALPVDDFSLSVTPATETVAAGGSATYNISTLLTKGVAQSIMLSANNLPTGVLATFSPNPVATGVSAQLTLSTVTGAMPGAFTFTVSGAGTEVSHSASATIIVGSAFTPSATAMTFASQTVSISSASQSLLITNPDNVMLPLTFLVDGPNSGEFTQTNNCPAALPPSASCTVTITFTPGGTGPRSALLRLMSSATVGQTIVLNGTGVAACASISSCAYQELNQSATEDTNNFWVFKDADSGLNHGVPSGVFVQQVAFSSIVIDTGCVDLATSATGCSSDPNAIDVTRGTVLRIAFPGLSGVQFAGVNIQEPSDFSPNVPSLGYNFTSASSIQFDARSPQNATVRFGVGGCVTPYIPVPPTWTSMSISLSSLSCKPDLTNVHLLFAVSADLKIGSTGASILLDNIRFLPLPSSEASVLSLPVSTRTVGVPPHQNYPIPTDQVNRNPSTVYEVALTIAAFLARGQAQDIANATVLANTLDYALHHENSGDPVPMLNGSIGLHTAYEAGDISFLNAQAPSVGSGHAGDSRLAGFSASSTLCGPTGFCLVLDGASAGSNAWAIIALATAFQHTGNAVYLTDAEIIGNWIAGLADTTGTGFGGYYLGYSDGGTPKQLLLGKSTAQNAAIFTAFNLLSQIETLRGNGTQASSWAGRAKFAGDFVLQMLDPVKGRFNTGTLNNVFTTGPGVGICPSTTQIRGADTVNTCDFLDADTMPILAMSGSAAYGNVIQWSLPAQYLSTFAQTVSAAGGNYQGFGLIPATLATGIGWEFTSQAAAVYQTGILSNGAAMANTYAQQIAFTQNHAPFGDGMGVVGATLQNGETVAPPNQCLTTPFACVPERPTLAATTWAMFVDQQVNPLSPATVPIKPSTSAVSFGPTPGGTPAPTQPVTLFNAWSVSVKVALSVAGVNSGDFSVTGCPTTLAAGTSCVLNVGFTPNSSGPRVAALSISQTPSWAIFAGTSTIALTGTGNQTGAVPSVISFTPVSGTGSSPTFIGVYSSTVGGGDILATQVLVSATGSSANSCYFGYDKNSNSFLLLNDAGNAWLTPGAAPGSGSVSNSQCTVLGSGSNATISGNQLTVGYNIQFKAAFAGAKTIWTNAYSVSSGLGSAFQSNVGGVNLTWTVTGGAPVIPTVVSFSPQSGVGISQAFTAVYSSTVGGGDILATQVLVSATGSSANSCYSVTTNTVTVSCY